MRSITFYLFTFLIFFPVIAIGQFGQNVEFLGNALVNGGYYQDVVISGNYAYAVDSYGLAIFDISDPDTLVLMSNLATPGSSSVLAVSGDYVYIGDEQYGLIVVNVSDHSYPQIAGYYQIGNVGVRSIFVQGNLLYLAVRTWGLYVFDISTPTSPILTGNFTSANFDAHGVWVVDSLAYIANWDFVLMVFNVVRSDSIYEINELELPGQMYDVFVQGNYAYVAARDSGMRIVDISDMNNLQEVGSYNLIPNHQARNIFVKDTVAFIAYTSAGLHLVNISNPTSPAFISSITNQYVNGVFTVGSTAYLACFSDRLMLIDVSNPASPLQSNQYRPPEGKIRSVQKSGNIAYVTGDGILVTTLDISDPHYPSVLYSLPLLGGNGINIVVRDNLAFVTATSRGLYIVSVADPAAPSQLSVYDTPGWAWGLDVQGNYAYVADSDSGLRIIDISNPQIPVEVGYFDSVVAEMVDVEGNYAYLVHNNWGIYILDIFDPIHPTKIGELALSGWPSDVQVIGDLAFLACNDLSIINVTDPTQPHVVGQVGYSGVPKAVFVENNYAYCLTSYGLHVIDVADTNNLIDVGSYDTPGSGYDVFVENNSIYVADYYAFEILHFNPPSYINATGKELVSRTFLYQNYPNPFNPVTSLQFDLPRTGQVTLKIYNILGEEVATLVSQQLPAGSYSYEWDASNLASGIYLYRLEAEGYVETRKMVVMK